MAIGTSSRCGASIVYGHRKGWSDSCESSAAKILTTNSTPKKTTTVSIFQSIPETRTHTQLPPRRITTSRSDTSTLRARWTGLHSFLLRRCSWRKPSTENSRRLIPRTRRTYKMTHGDYISCLNHFRTLNTHSAISQQEIFRP